MKTKLVLASDVRAGDLFWDPAVGEWLRVDKSATQCYCTFLDMPTGNYRWEADGHRYQGPLRDKYGDLVYVLVMDEEKR